MKVSAFLFGGLILSFGAMVRAQCSQFVAVHEIISSAGGVMTIDDEAGSREIKAETFNSADCDVSTVHSTGEQYAGNYTIIGQQTANPNGCEIKNIGGVPTLDSIQAIKIETNGWTMNHVQFDFDDLDSSRFGWEEAMAVIGVRGGSLVTPTVSLGSPTILTTKSYNVPSSVATLLGLGGTPFNAPGAEVTSTGDVECSYNDSPENKKCRATVEFSSPIDTLIILYAVVERGLIDSRSGAFFSELRMSCGCRCRQTNPGTRMAFSPVPGVPGECVQREISSPRNECDVLGANWCQQTDSTDYIPSGGVLASGNYGCSGRDSSRISYVSAFSPASVFGIDI